MSRIVVLSRRNILHPLAGGASLYQHEIFRRLANEHDITVLADGGKVGKPVEDIDGVSYVNLHRTLMRARLPLLFLKKFAAHADLLVDHGDVAIPWLSPLFARIPRLTIIHQLIREIFYSEFPRALATLGFLSERALYRLYARSWIVAASESTAYDLVSLGIPRENIVVISPGCSNVSASRIQLDQRTPLLVGCVSRLMRYKGLQFAIKALACIIKDHPDARMQIAGIGPYQEELRNLVRHLDIVKNVTFLGRVTEERKIRVYCESRVVVAPSTKEGYGLSVIEANSVGTPVVGWNVSGLRDSILNNHTGLLAPFPNHQKFAECIDTLLTDDSEWNRLSKTAWTWAHSHSWDQAASDFRKTIEHVLNFAT